jgi:hypothetical protein
LNDASFSRRRRSSFVELTLRDVARHEDMGFDAGRSRVGRGRAGGISGGRDRDPLYAEFEGHGNGAWTLQNRPQDDIMRTLF